MEEVAKLQVVNGFIIFLIALSGEKLDLLTE